MKSAAVRALVIVGALAVLGPCLFALYLECKSGAVHLLPDGDEAVIETRLLTFARAVPLLGPYSRFGWNHPGPLLFFVFAPLYFLFGKSSVAIAVTAATLNALALAASIAILWRTMTGPWQRAVALLLVMVFINYFGAIFLPTSYSIVWNPVITILPYGLLLLVCAALACGRPAFLLPAVVLHAFITQSHVAYALSGSVALAGALLLALVARRETGGAGARRWWIASGVVLAVLWAPTALDAAFGSRNLLSILKFFAGPRRVFTVGPGPALALVAWRALAPWRAVWGDPRPDRPSEAGALAVGLLVVVCGSLLACQARARRTGRRFAGNLCLLLSAQLVVAWLSTLRIDTPDQPYLTWWIAVLGIWSVIAIAGAVLPGDAKPQPLTWTSIAARSAPVLLAAVCSARSVTWLETEYYEFARHVEANRRPAVDLARSLDPLFRRGSPVRIAIRRHELWGSVAGVLVELGKADIWPVLEPSWHFMFGPGYAYGDREGGAPTLSFHDGLVHDARLLRLAPSLPPLYVYTSEREPPPDAPSAPPLQIVASSGARGDVANLVDGATDLEGAHWDVPGSVLLDTTQSSITLALPGRDLKELVVTADGNDSYWVEGSADGARFERVGAIPNPSLFGLRTRRIAFERPRPWSYVRIGPEAGDGLYSLRHVAATLGDWGVQPIGSSPATLVLPEAPIQGLRVARDGAGTYSVEGSLDGRMYVPLGTISPADPSDQGWRDFYFNDDELWCRVRMSREPGDPQRPMPDVRPLVSAGEVMDPGVPGRFCA